MYGPITYDLASLFKDAFISLGRGARARLDGALLGAGARAGLPVDADFGAFYRDFEWMGLQRHLKVLGIFARLSYRDGKAGYLEDTPRFVAYLRAVAARYNGARPAAAPVRRPRRRGRAAGLHVLTGAAR